MELQADRPRLRGTVRLQLPPNMRHCDAWTKNPPKKADPPTEEAGDPQGLGKPAAWDSSAPTDSAATDSSSTKTEVSSSTVTENTGTDGDSSDMDPSTSPTMKGHVAALKKMKAQAHAIS